jgi:hypothetical protein
MNRYKLGCIDCIWKRRINVHLLESIKIYFYIDSWDHYVIEYNFHQKDFYLWKDILEIHREDIDDYTLYDDLENKVLESLENEFEYYVLRLKSKDINLYRNISLIMYIKDENGWDNSEEMLKRNTWDL